MIGTYNITVTGDPPTFTLEASTRFHFTEWARHLRHAFAVLPDDLTWHPLNMFTGWTGQRADPQDNRHQWRLYFRMSGHGVCVAEYINDVFPLLDLDADKIVIRQEQTP